MKEFHVLSLGAGVQSTTLYLLACAGEIHIEHAVFADTGAEPKPVYAHLEWLKTLGGPPISVVTQGNLRDAVWRGENSTGQRFASIPAFLLSMENGKLRNGQQRRQCTYEHKIRPIEKFVRRQVVGLKPRQRMPADVVVHQYYGISLDEAGRAVRVRANAAKENPWITCHFPLLEQLWTRDDCKAYLKPRVPHETPKSACTFCPYRRNAEWRWLRDHDPEGFADAVALDAHLREPGAVVARGMKAQMYLHDSRIPLADVNLEEREKTETQAVLPGFNNECLGMCGL